MPILVATDSPLALSVDRLEGRWILEFGGRRFAWDEAWLWGDSDGYALFEHSFRFAPGTARRVPGSERWVLQRVWVRPELRRQGLLSAVWPTWRNRYGDFHVTAPSTAMQAFLAAHG